MHECARPCASQRRGARAALRCASLHFTVTALRGLCAAFDVLSARFVARQRWCCGASTHVASNCDLSASCLSTRPHAVASHCLLARTDRRTPCRAAPHRAAPRRITSSQLTNPCIFVHNAAHDRRDARLPARRSRRSSRRRRSTRVRAPRPSAPALTALAHRLASCD